MHLWFCHIYYRSLYAVRKNSHCSKGAVSEEKGGGGGGKGMAKVPSRTSCPPSCYDSWFLELFPPAYHHLQVYELYTIAHIFLVNGKLGSTVFPLYISHIFSGVIPYLIYI